MNVSHLNEHDANQGAQSTGEFLGMSGNSGWYLLGSAGATILMVILLWGMLGMSLLMCLLVGAVLCALSVTYVFTLKNNKPEHYDTDFFESALIEAGVMELRFGPQPGRSINPFSGLSAQPATVPVRVFARSPFKAAPRKVRSLGPVASAADAFDKPFPAEPPKAAVKKAPMVPQEDYAELQERLHAAEEQLDEVFTERLEA
ncbi:MAG: DUF4133 domain-containing protein [Verrucomicrobiota bacterium]